MCSCILPNTLSSSWRDIRNYAMLLELREWSLTNFKDTKMKGHIIAINFVTNISTFISDAALEKS